MIELRAIERQDLRQLRDWRNALRKNFRQWHPLGMEDQEAWFRRIQRRDREIMLAVWSEDQVLGGTSYRLIGVVGLTYIDWIRRKAEASIYIGSDQHRGKGYGKAGLQALLDYGFGEIGLHRIYAEVFENNPASLALFKSCGFTVEGRQMEAHFAEGRWWGVYMCGQLEATWRARLVTTI